jgi:hypothetical protein
MDEKSEMIIVGCKKQSYYPKNHLIPVRTSYPTPPNL